MEKFLPILVVGILVLSGLGAVAFNVNISKDEKQTSFFDELDQSQTVMTDDTLAIPVGHFEIQDTKVNVQVAQSFIPSKDVTTRVELFIGKNSTATYPLTVSIREELTEDDLTVIDVDPSEVPTEEFDWVAIDFDDVFLTTGQTYYIVALTENVTDNYYAWGANNLSESYPDGCAWFSIDEGDTWTNESASSSYPSTTEAFSNQGAQPIFEDNVTWDMCFKTYGRDNLPPEAPSITGETNGKKGTEYEYTFNATDPDGDPVMYFIDWGDNNTEWTEYCDSGKETTLKHTWSEKGDYTITAKAQDIYGAEGPEGTLEVTMPRNKAFNFNYNLLEHLFDRFPNMFPVLRYLLGL